MSWLEDHQKRVKSCEGLNSCDALQIMDRTPRGVALAAKHGIPVDKPNVQAYAEMLAMKPQHVAEYTKNILLGDFTSEIQKQGTNILASKGNRVAQMGQLIAKVGFGLEPKHATKAWKSIHPEAQRRVNEMIAAHIEKASPKQSYRRGKRGGLFRKSETGKKVYKKSGASVL